MKLNYSIYLIFILAFQAIGQQNKFDSIENILKSKVHDTLKCNILANFIESGLDENVWPIYNEKLLHLSLNAAKNANKEDYKRYYYSVYSIALSNKGFLARNKGNFKLSDSIYLQTLYIQKKLNHTEAIGTSYANIGANAKSQGNIKKSLIYYDSALKIFLKYNHKNQSATVYNNLAYTFSNEKDYKTAIKYYKNSIIIHKQMKDYSGMATVIGNLANVTLESLNQDDLNNLENKKIILESLILFERSEKITDSLNDENDHASFLNKLGKFYDYYGDVRVNDKNQSIAIGTKKAYDFYVKALKIREKTQHSSGLIDSYSSIASHLFKKNSINEAINYALKCLNEAKRVNNLEKINVSADMLYKYYKTKSDFKNALIMFELSNTSYDSLNNTSTKKEIIKKSFQLEYDKKAAADSVKISEEKKITLLKLNQEKAQKKYLYVGIGFIFLFALFIFNRYRVMQNQKKIIEKQKQLVEKQKTIVDEKQQEILASIRYAKKIQLALMPNAKYIKNKLQ